MNVKSISFALLILLVGIGIGLTIPAFKPVVQYPHTMEGTMASMTDVLDGKQGDEFDKAFIAGMIVHHQGAVEMAQAALTNAKHEEIKQMAGAIISAQTAEIAQMRAWHTAWYGGAPEGGAH